MAIYAISDLHLSFGANKPMDIFGDNWENHTGKLLAAWKLSVKSNDHVLLPGDLSWSIDLKGAVPDFEFLERLPGKKILSKGNHDYWWCTSNKFREFVSANGFETIRMLHNNAYGIGDHTICGSRGWKPLDDPDFTPEDRKVYSRELDRLRLSLMEGLKLGGELIVMLHYPPFDNRHRPNDFASVLDEYGVKTCIYGHIHGKASEAYREEHINGTRYLLVSADYRDFEPVRLV